MIVIGEKINATRKRIQSALAERDAEAIAAVARQQDQAGADYIDVNGGDPGEGKEVANMDWLMDVVQEATSKPVAVDTANPDAARVGLSKAKGKAILNSISLESDRLNRLLPLVGEFDCRVVALLMSDGGTPSGVEDRLEAAKTLLGHLTDAGKNLDEIIVDPCVLPVSADPASGARLMEAIAKIADNWPEVHIGGGLSNVSFGLPQRRWANLAALSQAIAAGMDYAILDPCAEGVMEIIHAAEAVAGRDEFCMNYVTFMRDRS